jgi:hypothetical protein
MDLYTPWPTTSPQKSILGFNFPVRIALLHPLSSQAPASHSSTKVACLKLCVTEQGGGSDILQSDIIE